MYVPHIRDQNAPTFTGSHGAVFKGRNRSPRKSRAKVQVLAMKEIQMVNEVARHRVEKEIRLLKQCPYPSVLKLADAYIIDEEGLTYTIFLVTTLWAPVSLQRFFEDLTSSEKRYLDSLPLVCSRTSTTLAGTSRDSALKGFSIFMISTLILSSMRT